VKRALILLLCVITTWGSGLCAKDRVAELRRELESADGSDRVRILNLLAREVQNNSPKEALAFANEALGLAEKLNDVLAQATALNSLGNGHYFQGEYEEALDYYDRSLRLAEKVEDHEAIARAVNNIGVIHYMWGEYDDSLKYYSRALEIRERDNDKLGIAVGHNNLGNVYYAAGRYAEALEHLDEAFALYTEIGNERLAASTLNNVGLVLHKTERYDEAMDTLERALATEERIGDQPGIALSLINIGLVHEARGRPREALDYYQRALRVREAIGDRQGAADCLQSIGQAYAILGEFGPALEYQNRALAIAEELHIREIQRDTHLGMSETYERMGDYRQALEAYKRYQQVNAELFNSGIVRRLAELQARYEVEKKDRAIENLVKDKEIQRTIRNSVVAVSGLLLVLVVSLYIGYRHKARANREIRRAHDVQTAAQQEREKATRAELAHVGRVATLGELSSVLAHELNQPLTAILANAQATRRLLASGRAEDSELDEAMADIVAAAGHASEIIKRLRGLLRRGDDTREPMDINEAIRAIEAFAAADARRHGATLTLELGSGLPPVLGDRVQVQQVLLNLVRNGAEAMRDNPSDDRSVVVATSRDDADSVVVSVSDAGPAVDERQLQRMFEPFFTTKSEGLGMGLAICQTIVESHGGRLWASRNPDLGLTVRFTLPHHQEHAT